MSEESDILLGLAERVTNGTAVNWASELKKTPHLSGELSELETVDRIRSAHEEADRMASTRTSDERRPLFTWGKLEVLEWVGEGSFGEVYRAYDPSLQTELALKLRKQSGSEEDIVTTWFLSEARRLARVRHPHVLVVYGVDTHDGRVGIWTEFLHGKNLEICLADQGVMNAREAALVGIDLCRALAAVHAAGVIHRDVKTTNVMRERGGRIVLMDFGSGGELPPDGKVGTTAHIHGTPLAMAPEQLTGLVAGPPTDLYGLGVLLYRLVSRAFPVEAGTVHELRERHARRERKPLRDCRADLPTDFVQVVERALELRPEDRFQTAGEMELALARTLESKLEANEPARHAVPKPSWFGTLPLFGPWGKIAISVTVAAAALAIAWGWYEQLNDRGVASKPPVSHGSAPTALTATVTLSRNGEAGEERLPPGARLALGDRLFMTIQGSDSMFVYVIDEDEAGDVYVLFPNPELSPANPLAPGLDHRLPERRGNLPADWKVTSAGGKETITVIATRRSIPAVEREIDRLPKASVDHPVVYAKLDAGAFRGIGGIETDPQSPRRVSDVLRAFVGRARGPDEPWVWQTSLENPRTSH